jgi:hypothetical protein
MGIHDTIEQHIKYDIYQPIRLLLMGDRGSGKSTALLFGKNLVENMGDNKIKIYESTGLDKSFSSLLVFLQKLNKKINNNIDLEKIKTVLDKSINFYEIAEEIDEHIGETRVVLLIDVPDTEGTLSKRYRNLATTLEYLIYTQKITIILALNFNQIKRFEKQSTLLGKFNEIPLRKFSLKQAEELIKLRLQKYRSDKKKELYPFAEDTVQLIHQITTGIPRAILKCCDRLFIHGHSKNLKIIEKEVAIPIISKYYAKDLIDINETDLTLRKQYMEIIEILQENDGRFENKSDLLDEIGKVMNYTLPTINRRLEKLQSWGIITIKRNRENMQSKEVFLRSGYG